jgi:very-short-patch-repair endonuclease
MAQVRLADVLKVKSGLDNSTRSSASNRIKAKHLDFVACDPSDMSVKFAIELDDSSHKQTKRMERDAFLNDAMQSAGIPLHRFGVKREYDPQEVYDKFFLQQQA